jgi:FHA domain-containing protein
MGCLCCGAEPEVGALCRSCALEVEPCDGLIPDHIHSKIDTTEAEAWVVDGFGGAHAIGSKSRIGRNHGSELIVLASSVSRDHAELERNDAGWFLRDLGSRNGTFVNGVRGQGAMPLTGRSVLKIGDVALWFVPEVVTEPAARPTMTTDGTKGGGLVRFELASGELQLCVVISGDDAGAGALLWRQTGGAGWSERSLAPLEFQLLRALLIRAHEESGSPSAIRGCVPTKQLVSELPFQSKYANQENVRQVVMRLRGALAEVGARGVLAVAPGRGYYLACPVTVASVN